MADLPESLKSLTVKALRDLARKHLGAGYSRLKTKSQLISALAKGLDAATAKVLFGGKAAKTKEAEKLAPKAKPAPPTPVRTAAPSRPAAKAAVPTATKAAITTKTSAPTKAQKAISATPAPSPRPQAGEGARSQGFEEYLGELPERYYDDAFVALAVDPQTLFLYWDHADGTVKTAAASLRSPRAVLSLHSEGERVREIDFALESRCFYVRGLAPGHSYHAEIDFVGADGRRQRLGRPSNKADLPPSGPSDVIDDRFIAFPWQLRRGWHLEERPVPGAAQRDLAASALRSGASMPGGLRPWLEGGGGPSGRRPTGVPSGRPLR